MNLSSFVRALVLGLAVALPMVFPFTQAPNPNFWPLMVAWGCGLLGFGVLWWWPAWCARSAPGGAAEALAPALWARWVAGGLLWGALLAAAAGLLQYFDGALGWAPWVAPSSPGLAMGNVRQRNQQASLLSVGVWALLWLLAQAQARLPVRWSATDADTDRAVDVGTGTGAGAIAGAGAGVDTRVPPPGAVGLLGVLSAWALVALALASAATASRTGLLQWLVLVALLWCWRASMGRLALVLALVGALVYGAAAWLLPQLLWQWTGFQADGLLGRFTDGGPACTSRRVLWANVLHLIAQKPWLGWGWGELDYAHYITLFPGERFCTLLDNAHNLPLHLAVELGLPVALVLCGAAVWALWRAQPWREVNPARQLAWGMLAVVGIHSLLEFPLWYGPFQWMTVLALVLLLVPQSGSERAGAPEAGRARHWAHALALLRRPGALAVQALVVALLLAGGGYVSAQYLRLAQVFVPPAQRAGASTEAVLAQVAGTRLFADQLDFVVLTTTPVTPATASRIYPLAQQVLHFSPEPRVIEALIESAALLGHDAVVAQHLHRYRAAFPAEFARWSAANRAIAAGARPAP